MSGFVVEGHRVSADMVARLTNGPVVEATNY